MHMEMPMTLRFPNVRRLMSKRISAWKVLICFFLGGILTAFFGWIVRTTADGFDTFGEVGKASVAVADYVGLLTYSMGVLFEDPDGEFVIPRTVTDLTGFHPVQARSDIHVTGLLVRKDERALAGARGWRYLVGVFTIDGKVQNAVLLLSPELDIVRVWILNEGDVPGQTIEPENHKFLHGFSVLKDGSMIFLYDGGKSIQRVNLCGKRMWVTAGMFNHSVSVDDEEASVWTIEGFLHTEGLSRDVGIAQLSTADGKVLRRISVGDMIDANPTIDILGVRQKDEEVFGGGSNFETKKWEYDPFHLNDVEPLPARFSDRFKKFSPGDLLISARSLDLLFVLDPNTLKVKWWLSGATRRQHDPDWEPNGKITVFDNNMGRKYSRIMEIDPSSNSTRVLFDGSGANFYSDARGEHQLTAAGDLLITSPAQGRFFEVGPSGQIVFEIANTKPGSKFNYLVSEAVWFPYHAFNSSTFPRCMQ